MVVVFHQLAAAKMAAVDGAVQVAQEDVVAGMMVGVVVAGMMVGVGGAVLAQEHLAVVISEPEAGAMVDVALEGASATARRWAVVASLHLFVSSMEEPAASHQQCHRQTQM